MSHIKISVVIPTYNRRDLLRYTLQALEAQSLPREMFEVIVVDDGGSDGSERVVEEFFDVLNVKYFWQEDKGFRAGKARNIGTAIAQGAYVVYIDTGVLLSSTALAEHLRIHDQSERPTVIIGYVYGFGADNDTVDEISKLVDCRDVDATIARLKRCNTVDIRQRQYDEIGDNIEAWPAPFDIMWTCHISAEREEILKAGLFDEKFKTWGGEDVDLGVRFFLNENNFVLGKTTPSVHWPHKKEVDDHQNCAIDSAKKIHAKYNLWETSFYRYLDLSDERYALNKIIMNRQRLNIVAPRRSLGDVV